MDEEEERKTECANDSRAPIQKETRKLRRRRNKLKHRNIEMRCAWTFLHSLNGWRHRRQDTTNRMSLMQHEKSLMMTPNQRIRRRRWYAAALFHMAATRLRSSIQRVRHSNARKTDLIRHTRVNYRLRMRARENKNRKSDRPRAHG